MLTNKFAITLEEENSSTASPKEFLTTIFHGMKLPSAEH